MKLSIPESKLNSKKWGGRGGEKGADAREREKIGWESVLGEKGLNKKAASGIYEKRNRDIAQNGL